MGGKYQSREKKEERKRKKNKVSANWRKRMRRGGLKTEKEERAKNQGTQKRRHDLSHCDGRGMAVGKTWQGSRRGLCVVTLEETIDRVWQGCASIRERRMGGRVGPTKLAVSRTRREADDFKSYRISDAILVYCSISVRGSIGSYY